VKIVTILGDALKAGPYSQLLKVDAHAQIAAHHHAGDRIGTVLKGSWRFGYGSTFDKAALKILPMGSVYTEPSGSAHFAMTGDEPVIVIITGTGRPIQFMMTRGNSTRQHLTARTGKKGFEPSSNITYRQTKNPLPKG